MTLSGTYSAGGTVQNGRKTGTNSRVLVGLSGQTHRADSYVVAALLRSQGHEVIGCHLRVAPLPEGWGAFKSSCVQQPALSDIQSVCKKLDIQLHVVDARDLFLTEVADQTVHTLLNCYDPQPCIPCNDRVRIPLLLKKAQELRCDWVATGHHAQLSKDFTKGLSEGNIRLLRSSNREWDQSRDLFRLKQDQLKKLLFPLGTLSSALLARLATELGFEEAGTQAQGSTHSCSFSVAESVPLVTSRIASDLRPGGSVRHIDGHMLSEHNGLYHYRIGQTDHLPVPGGSVEPNSAVLGIDPMERALTIGPSERLKIIEFDVHGVTWVRPMDGLRLLECEMLVGFSQTPLAAQLTHYEDDRVHVRLPEESSKPLPGQAIVFMEGDEILGGGYVGTARKTI